MNTTLRRLLALSVLGLVLLLAWLLAGPWLALRGIDQALARRDVSKLARHVDYPALRANLRAQMEDRLAREIDARFGSGSTGVAAAAAARMLSDSAIDAAVSPAGLAVLLQGHALLQRATGNTDPEGGVLGGPVPWQPMQDVSTRFESPSRFVASSAREDGSRIDFILERQGLRWRLVDVRLPSAATPPAAATPE